MLAFLYGHDGQALDAAVKMQGRHVHAQLRKFKCCEEKIGCRAGEAGHLAEIHVRPVVIAVAAVVGAPVRAELNTQIRY